MSEEKKDNEKKAEEVGTKSATETEDQTTEERFTEIQKWLLENNLPAFLDKLLALQNIQSLNDIYSLDQDKIDAMMEIIPQLPVTNQLKKALYRASERIIMDEMESIFGKWRQVTEENKQLRKFNEVLIEQIGERNIVIKKLQQQNAKLTKDVLQATLALTQVQLHLVRQGIVVEENPNVSAMMNAHVNELEDGNENESGNANENDNENNDEDMDDEDMDETIANGQNSNNANETTTQEMKQCDLCEMEYNQVICVSQTCQHHLCHNCCKNSITGDISSHQMPECPVCRNLGNHMNISNTSQIWKNIVDEDIWTTYQGLSDTSV